MNAKKKLRIMRIHDDVPNSYIVLGRDEMKSIVAGSGQCECEYGGCAVVFSQTSIDWMYTVCCDGNCNTWDGSGQYGGTLCGGQCPSGGSYT